MNHLINQILLELEKRKPRGIEKEEIIKLAGDDATALALGNELQKKGLANVMIVTDGGRNIPAIIRHDPAGTTHLKRHNLI